MSDHALDIHLDKQDRYRGEDEVYCGWGNHWVHAAVMPTPHAFACMDCEAAFQADNAEVERMFVEDFGGKL